MNIKIKINRLCLILICAALLRGDSNNEKPQTHYLAPVNIIKKQKPLTKCKAAPRATLHQRWLPNSAPSMINKLASSSLTVSSQHQ